MRCAEFGTASHGQTGLNNSHGLSGTFFVFVYTYHVVFIILPDYSSLQNKSSVSAVYLQKSNRVEFILERGILGDLKSSGCGGIVSFGEKSKEKQNHWNDLRSQT